MEKLFINIFKIITSIDLDSTKALAVAYSSSRYEFITHYTNLKLCQFIQAGFMAGARYNPFLKPTENITVLRSK
tara:strand:- start:206 stop:427 length:222 start_codon:yes stop_codon:yes gene_type:complete